MLKQTSPCLVVYSQEIPSLSHDLSFQILESVQTLNLSSNALTDLHFLSAFIQVQTLCVAHNMVGTREGLSQLYNLKLLKTLSIKGSEEVDHLF